MHLNLRVNNGSNINITRATSSCPGLLWSLNQLKKVWYTPRDDFLGSLRPVRFWPRCHRMGLEKDMGDPTTQDAKIVKNLKKKI